MKVRDQEPLFVLRTTSAVFQAIMNPVIHVVKPGSSPIRKHRSCSVPASSCAGTPTVPGRDLPSSVGFIGLIMADKLSVEQGNDAETV